MHVAAEQSVVGTQEQDPFQGISHLIDDGHGHINSELATSIWNWENDHRNKQHLPKFQYSTRSGLRLVDEIARDLLETYSADTAYSDLIQEGVVALMYAMAKYDPHYFEKESFEHYARRTICTTLSRSLAKDSRPIRLPEHVVTTLKHARQARSQLQSQTGSEPTMAQVAEELQISPEQLQLYQIVSASTLSVESTVEIYDQADSTATFEDQDKWEKENGVDEESIDLYAEEGEDEMWVHQEQIAAPLRDMIPDYEPTPDDLVEMNMIHDDVDDFLVRTLQDRELQVIRMRYGLDSGKGMSLSAIGDTLGVTAARVKQIEERAMEKLRTTYTNREVEPYLEDEDIL